MKFIFQAKLKEIQVSCRMVFRGLGLYVEMRIFWLKLANLERQLCQSKKELTGYRNIRPSSILVQRHLEV